MNSTIMAGKWDIQALLGKILVTLNNQTLFYYEFVSISPQKFFILTYLENFSSAFILPPSLKSNSTPIINNHINFSFPNLYLRDSTNRIINGTFQNLSYSGPLRIYCDIASFV